MVYSPKKYENPNLWHQSLQHFAAKGGLIADYISKTISASELFR